MIRTYLHLGIAGLVAAAVAVAGIQSSRLATTHADLTVTRADLTSVRADLASARADVARIARDRTTALVVLARERDRAVKAEQEAARLRIRIAKNAGTERDGEVAPVLRDALEALQRTASRQDSLYLGRRPDVWLRHRRQAQNVVGRSLSVEHADEIACFRSLNAKRPPLAAAEWEWHIGKVEAFFRANARDPWYLLAGTKPENHAAELLRFLRRDVAEADALPMPPEPAWYLKRDERHERRLRVRKRF